MPAIYVMMAHSWKGKNHHRIRSGASPSGAGAYIPNNGYEQFVELDLESFRVRDIRQSPTGDVPIEWISTEHPVIHALSDKRGRLLLGDLETGKFPTTTQVDAGANLHRVRYDPIFDRFWATQDSGASEHFNIANGVVTVLPDGTIEDKALFAQDDVEFISFSPDYRRAYSGGFDGVLHMIRQLE